MWTQVTDPFSHLWLSSLVAALPILFLFVILISRKLPGYIAVACTLLIALGVAIFAYGMPAHLALLASLDGALNGLFPIGWIVFSAVLLYNLSVKSGSFQVVRDTIESITQDRRLQALLIAFCFGAFLEGSAGFGAPVAITASMLVGLGFLPLYAAGICLIANTAPVAFGGIGIAIITAGRLSGIDPNILSRMVAHQLPLIALVIPFWLVMIIAGWKGAKQVMPAIIVAGVSYSVTMFLSASYLGPFLPDILSSLVSISALVAFLRFWQPKEIWRFPHEASAAEAPVRKKHSLAELVRAWTPFLLLIIFVSNWGIDGIHKMLAKASLIISIHGLNGHVIANGKAMAAAYSFDWLAAAGTAILFAAILSAFALRLSMKAFAQVAVETLQELAKPLMTVALIVSFAYLANFSGISTTLGHALTSTGRWFPLLSPILGWLGVFITGSDTSSNALFSSMQHHTASQLGINPVLTVSANTSGGVTAKMISPQSIAVATAATGLTGQEGTLFRFTIGHSLALLAIISVMTYVQAYYLPWMVPNLPPEDYVAAAAKGLSTGDGTFIFICLAAAAALVAYNLIQPKRSARA